MIKDSVQKIERGTKIADTSGAALKNIVVSVKKVSDLNNEIATASTEPAPLTVSLLVTPSIGCSDPVHYLVKEGRVYAD